MYAEKASFQVSPVLPHWVFAVVHRASLQWTLPSYVTCKLIEVSTILWHPVGNIQHQKGPEPCLRSPLNGDRQVLVVYHFGVFWDIATTTSSAYISSLVVSHRLCVSTKGYSHHTYSSNAVMSTYLCVFIFLSFAFLPLMEM
jgi:hypothetical protein